MFLLPGEHLTDIKQAVILENKIVWLFYCHIAKNKIEYWFYDKWSVWKQHLWKVEICQEDEYTFRYWGDSI
jgi:hypothetical protein